jgi:DNA-binding CsgD family transcriptional regulator
VSQAEIPFAAAAHMRIADNNGTEQLSELIIGIYDAALEHSLWPDVLKRVAKFVGGPAAALFSKDASNKTGMSAYDTGIEPHYREIYFEKYIKLDPATTGHFFGDVEEPMATADLVPYDEFLQSQFYQEWAKPQGFVDFVAAVLDKSTTRAAMFGVFRHEHDGVVDNEVKRRMRLVVPHIRRAVLIGRLIDLKTAEAATLSDVFDNLATSMCMLDATLRIVHANAACHVLLAEGNLVRSVSGRFEARDPQVDAELREIIWSAGLGDRAIGTRGIALPMMNGHGARYVAHILPLNTGLREKTANNSDAVAAVFIQKANIEGLAPPEIIAKAFKLTPTELRILLAIVEVGGAPEVAVALGIAESTVKTHLGRLYEKTGAKRQADLVKIFASYTTPLAK